ncbi:MAG: hypothetical protein GXP53_13885, partial [Deltaproteobacteria bacterium]|nr:hypothetical protein [Deltaproteobacteria bacterium]
MKPSARRFNKGTCLFAWFAFISLICCGQSPAFADVGMDIRTAGPLVSNNTSIPYVVVIDDCTDVISVGLSAGDNSVEISVSDMERISDLPAGRGFVFTGTGADRFSPYVTIHFRDGSLQTHSETFEAEDIKPSLSFREVGLSMADGRQFLVVSADAQDNVDISYLDFSVTGLRASALRAAGGVVERAREQAFAATDGFQRVYPAQNSQETYLLSVPIGTEMDTAAFSHDGLVLLDIVAVDASGNQASLSRIAFTGKDVVEQASNLSVQPNSIVFNNLLQTATLIPSVFFQFRGETPLPGPGNGVTYASSDPSRVSVTSSGVVYPLAETGDEDVRVTVSYPGVSPVEVPINVDTSKHLVSLTVSGLDPDGRLVLDRLNHWFSFPAVTGVFDDGSEAEVASQFSLEYIVDGSAAGIIETDDLRGLYPKAIIPSSTPLQLEIRLVSSPEIKCDVPVVAEDALPGIKLSLPSRVKSGDQLKLIAEAIDDVGISEVRFLLDGNVIGVSRQAPYNLIMDIGTRYLHKTFNFQAMAVDSAGQQSLSAITRVAVVDKFVANLPKISMEQPLDMQRIVEGAPIKYQAAAEIAGPQSQSGISYVEFFANGNRVGQAFFPLYEERSQPDESGQPVDKYFEIWRMDGITPEISTSETSMGVYAIAHDSAGGQVKSAMRLIRVVANQAPEIRIISPEQGTGVCAGQPMDIKLEMADDTLSLGLSTRLLVNGELFATYDPGKDSDGLEESIGMQRMTHSFQFPVAEGLVGATLAIEARAVDFHGIESSSSVVKVPVRGDTPPSVAISYPTEGMHFVAGLPVEIRASATDDVEIKRVDFYVDDHLVGSDDNAFFACTFPTKKGFSSEKQVKIHAVAIDSAGHETRSAPVIVTVGRDNQPPVVNIVSPAINRISGGDDVASVIEESEIAFKVTGYDNVDVTRLELRGIKKVSGRYELTGNMDDTLTESEFSPQQIPGSTLHAFSAVKLVHVPLFSRTDGVDYDAYPVAVKAFDAAGNQSVAPAVIAVYPDTPPEIDGAVTDRVNYTAKDTVFLDVRAKDDVGVSSISIDFLTSDGQTVLVSLTTPSQSVHASFSLDLAALNLPADTAGIRARIVAMDTGGRRSDGQSPFVIDLPIVSDAIGPIAAINTPVPGTTLYHGQAVTFSWKAVDGTGLAEIKAESGATILFSESLDGRKRSGQFNYTVPAAGESLAIMLTATDVFGNASSTTWEYTLSDDTPPVIVIRSPAQGTRLSEGEPFTMAAGVTDNRQVASVTFFIDQGETTLFSKDFTGAQAEAAMEAGTYLTASMRVPHRPDEGSPPLVFGVLSTDDAGLSATATLDLSLLEDTTAPSVILEKPDSDFSIAPAAMIQVAGKGDDDYYIESVTPLLIDSENNETILPWAFFSRKDRVEELTAPNPDSFGAVMAGRHFFLDFSGGIQLPASFLEKAGQVFSLVFVARDYGYNESRTRAVSFTVLGDEQAPGITILSPGQQVLENQNVPVSIRITDDYGISGYRIYLEGQADQPLAEVDGLDSRTEETHGINIGIGAYDHGNPDANRILIVAEATDASGNTARKVVVARIIEDLPPVFTVTDEYPAGEIISGGLAFQTIRMEESLAASDTPVSYFPVFTSF